MNHWKQVDIYHVGDDYYRSLITDIRSARHSITLESYIFAVDKLTQIILEELGQARKRGCKVHMLIDGFGSYYWLNELEKICRQKKINLRIYHPLPRGLNSFRKYLFFYVFTLRTVQLFKKLNKRNHRKVTIIDEKIAFLGSLNFTQYHSESIMGELAWRDTGVRVEGAEVARLVIAFKNAWQKSTKKGFRHLFTRHLKHLNYSLKTSLVRLNYTTRMRFLLYRDLLRRINSAEKHILVATAYFVPKRSLLRALKKAAQRGVQVEILVPGVTDIPVVRWAAFSLAHTLLKSGVLLHEYQKKILHAKYMIIDDYASIGSLNLNHRSLVHDLEVEMVLSDQKQTQALIQQWHEDKNQCAPLVEETLRNQSIVRFWLSRIAFKLRYLL